MNKSLRAFLLVSMIAVVPMLLVPGLGDAQAQGMDRRDDRRDDRGGARDTRQDARDVKAND